VLFSRTNREILFCVLYFRSFFLFFPRARILLLFDDDERDFGTFLHFPDHFFAANSDSVTNNNPFLSLL